MEIIVGGAAMVIVIGIIAGWLLSDEWVLIAFVTYFVFMILVHFTMSPGQSGKENALIFVGTICGLLFVAAMIATWIIKTPKVKKTEVSREDTDEK